MYTIYLYYICVVSFNLRICLGYTTWAEYIHAWKTEYPIESGRMYPYGESYHDTSATSAERLIGFDPSIDFILPYYGVDYSSVYVSIHGHLTPSRSRPAPQVIWKQAAEGRWPNAYYPYVPDPPFIGLFYAEATFNQHLPDRMEPSRIYYRTLHHGRDSSPTDISSHMLQTISEEVRAAVVGAEDFMASDGLVVTWYRFTHRTANCMSSTCPRNTVQCAVITDGIRTFSVFNYLNVDWLGSGSQGCHPQSGRPPGPENKCQPAFLGFNGGQGRGFTPLPYSNTDLVLDIDHQSGSMAPGRFIYQISQHHIIRGGCTNDTVLDNSEWPLSASPLWGGMLGGHEVTVSAPCFASTALIKCRFGDIITDVISNDYNMMKAVCKQPILEKVGWIKLSLSVDGGLSFKYHTDYNVVAVDYIEEKISVEAKDSDWLNPSELIVTWDTRHLETNSMQRVDIKLYGYRENHDGTSQWRELHIFGEGVMNSGHFTIHPNQHICESASSVENLCLNFEVGLVQINVSPADPIGPQRIWSDPIPLAWFNKDTMDDEYGSEWAHEKCRIWHGVDVTKSEWHATIEPCPCIMQQATADVGRFQTEVVQYPDKICYRSMKYSALEHSGSLCCYNHGGHLLYSGDNIASSAPSRRHPWLQSDPHEDAPHVPTMSHWLHDVIPYYHCCKWQDNDQDCYGKFAENRLTVGCSAYDVSGQASVFGDPHITTLDNTAYTFNGRGEFWLARIKSQGDIESSTEFVAQGRFERPEAGTYGVSVDLDATILSSVVMQHSNGTIVEILVNKLTEHQQKLVLNVNKQRIDSTNRTQHIYKYQDVTIYKSKDDVSVTELTVAFSCGVGVRASYKSGLLHTMFSFPSLYFNRVEGLFGTWNNHSGDDLTPAGGGQAVPPDDLSRVHHQFGITWNVAQTASRFMYVAKLDHKYFEKLDFQPNFVQGPNDAICAGSKSCAYDLSTTGSHEIAVDTLNFETWQHEVRVAAQSIAACGWLNVTSSLKEEPFNYTASAQVVISGCREGFRLEGPTQYTCINVDAQTCTWSPPVTTKCIQENNNRSTKVRIAIGAGIGIGILLILIILGIVAFICYARQKRKDSAELRKEYPKTKKMPADEMEVSKSGSFKTSTLKSDGSMKKPPRPCPDYQMLPADEDQKAFDAGLYDNNLHDEQGACELDGSFVKETRFDSPAMRRKAPYQYPRNTAAAPQTYRTAPYRYPNNSTGLTPEEYAISRYNAKQMEYVA